MIGVRKAQSIYQAQGEIENGTFLGRWHFSFAENYDPRHMHFGTLRVFNDDTLSPGAVWPLHPHREIEVVTYCAAGEFRHADQRGKGGVLKQGWVQHTTVGKGIFHSEINNLPDQPMRFIQMWFIPEEHGLPPSVEQKQVERSERTNTLLALVSNTEPGALKIASDAAVHSCFLQKGRTVLHTIPAGHGGYLYLLDGGPVSVNQQRVETLDAATIENESDLRLEADGDAELLLVTVSLKD
ncbi:MAG: pirin family protein [Solirubrobacterales bacterium]